MGFVGHIVYSGASGARIVNALFFMLGWNWYEFEKKHDVTRYTELQFLNPVGSGVTYHILVCLTCKTSKHYFSCLGGPGAVSIKSTL
jgi:hypothetical protein